MFQHSSQIITAWNEKVLVGVSRNITDWIWICYFANLAVRHEYKKFEIGKKLIELTKEKVGEQSMVLLLSAPTAMKYYPKAGFTKQESSFIMNLKSNLGCIKIFAQFWA